MNNESRYLPVRDKATVSREILSTLIGQKLIGACIVPDTYSQFYFGRSSAELSREEGRTVDSLGVQCPWRFYRKEVILFGSEDGSLTKENPTDQTSVSMESAIGDEGLTVLSITTDGLGGLLLTLSGDYFLKAFPTSDIGFSWLFSSTNSPCLVLMNGLLNRADPSSRADGHVDQILRRLRFRPLPEGQR